MNDRTNDERLRILKERLAQIKQKRDNPAPQNYQKREVEEVTARQVEETIEKKEPIWGLEEEKKKASWLKYFILLISGGLIGFYAYNNINSYSVDPELASSKEAKEEVTSTKLEYNLNLEGNNIAITASFEDESSAKAMVNDLKVKGYKCDYFFLPNKSNSKEEVYKVFIGPYDTEEETNQWTENLEFDFEIIKL